MKFAVIGNYGTGNLGDEAILSGLTFAIKEKHPGAEVVVIGKGRLLPLGVRSFLKSIVRPSLWKEPLRLIKSCDRVILGGGGLFSDEERSFTAIFWALHGIISLKLLKKPVECLGISIGRVSWISRIFIKWLFKRSQLVMVRDKGSHDLLSSWGVSSTLGSDLALLMPVDLNHGGLLNDKKYVFLSLREYRNIDEKLYKIFVQLCDYIVAKKGLNIVLIPFKMGGKNDGIIMNKILEQVNDKSMVEILTDSEDIEQVLSTIRGAELGIVMRLHAGIFSLICETPFIPISYTDKVADFWSDSKLPVLKVGDLTLKGVIDAFEHAYERRKSLKNDLKALHSQKLEQVRSSI